MEFLKFDINKCVLCGVCVEKCPFGALTIEGNGIVVGDACRMCGLCVRNCPEKAIRFEQKAKSFDKDKWKNFLIYVEQERGEIHPVTFELIGEARKMAVKVGYQVNCVIVGGKGTKENAEKLLPYGVDNVYVYEHGDTFGNAVEERHCDDTYITWDRFGHVAEVNADDVAEHVQTNDDQCRSCGKGRDCQEDRGQEQGQTE